MLNIKKIIVNYLIRITLIMVIVVLCVCLLAYVLNEQRKAQLDSEAIFSQIEHILAQNQTELSEIKEEYSRTCLHNAEAIADFLQNNPSAIDSVEELRKIAGYIEVDEIHIFDKTGRIFTGTHPEYYNLTFDSGEQIGFFKSMLQDKSLKLVQDIAPNTAEGKLMQYSAIWSENGEFIVQVGMEPVNVMKVTEKNELSYIFSLLKANTGVTLYAIDTQSGEIKGSTSLENVGKNASDIGLDLSSITKKNGAFHAKINGVDSYCIFKQTDDNFIGRIISDDVLYKNIPISLITAIICLASVTVILVITVSRYLNKYVINGILDINKKLEMISSGNLDEKVDVNNSLEFSALSNHINDMVKSLLSSTEKISYILSRTHLNIGVYEYNEQMTTVRFTDDVPKILNLNAKATMQLTADNSLFKEFINKLRNNPVEGECGVFRLDGSTEHYIKHDEIIQGGNVLGIVMDITDERRKVEAERDVDTLTGLYNRYGLDNKLKALFKRPEKLGYGAMLMIDADDLKDINDKYGTDKGDIYLQKLAGVIGNFGFKSSVAARQGCDEFVLFLYNYDDENEIINTIKTFEYVQSHSSAHLDDDLSVPLRFSFGYSMIKGHSDYSYLLKNANEKMYENKKQRKLNSSNDIN